VKSRCSLRAIWPELVTLAAALVTACGAAPLPSEQVPEAHVAALPAAPITADAIASRGAPEEAPVLEAVVISVPDDPPEALLPRNRVAAGLANPRGMLGVDGGLLVAIAGTGDPRNPNTGALVRLTDRDGDGDFLDRGEITTLLGRQPSRNILEIVRRDEVFGMAAVAAGGGEILATLAFFGGPSTVLRVTGNKVEPLGNVHGNLNDLAYHPGIGRWFAVSSSSDEVLRLDLEAMRGDRVVKIPPLEAGQDPVPGYLEADPVSGRLLVSLFSGSTQGETGGEGTELELRAGAIVSVDPETGATSPLVARLTAPTDLLVTEQDLYVLEFCDAFVEPIGTRAGLRGEPRHGGFKRFSGRLLRVDRQTRAVTVVARGLDGPTNLARVGSTVYVAQGMGTPGRPIPTPEGPKPLDGFIEAITLPQ
jgi:hypothetical protein